MKKIVLFSPGLNIGGIERIMVNYANLLADKYEVYYLTCHENGIFEESIDSNVKITNLKTNSLRRSIIPIARFLCKIKPTAIITANTAALIILLAKIISFSRVKVIASHHNFANCETKSIIDRKIIWQIYNWCDNVIAISDGIEKLLRSHVSKNKIIKIYNPLEYDKITSLANAPTAIPYSDYILFVGRFSKVKNIKRLLDACHINNIKNDILLVGEGPEEKYISNLIQEYGMENQVNILKPTNNPYPYIKNAKLLVLSSDSEAFPTVILEALTLGKTIVSTPTIGAKEILDDGKLGYIAPDFEPHKFGEILQEAIDKPNDSKFLMAEVRGRYSILQVLDQIKSII